MDELNVPADGLEDSIHNRIQLFLQNLPILTQENVPFDDSCPICLISFASIFAEASTSPSESKYPDIGITKLVGCGHLFCRKDLAEWVRSLHGNCPTCRNTFLDVHPPSESDEESSDGGEYLPDEDEEADGFPDTDGFSEAEEFGTDEMDLEIDEMSTGGDSEMGDLEWGLTDGESDSLSDGDNSFIEEKAEETGHSALESAVGISINEDNNLDLFHASSDVVQNEPK